MNRALLVVGCNGYDDPAFLPLLSAEHDAQAVFEVLTNGKLGQYTMESAHLLLSPSRSEVEDALRTLLFARAKPDVFTVYCAGHGDVVNDAFYYCVRDSISSQLSLTGISATSIFSAIAERQPQQANIIIDACQSGALASDLYMLTRAAMAGSSKSSSVTLFAAAASDQAAYEEDGHGIATKQLVRCLKGDLVTQTTRPYLDLIEIGRVVSNQIASTGRQQRAMVWGLNLHGASLFSLNPAYSGDAPPEAIQAIARAMPSLSPTLTDQIQSLYLTLKESSDIPRLLMLCDEMRTALEGPDTFAGFVQGAKVSFVERAEESHDKFLVPEVLAAFIVCLLPFGTEQPSIQRVREELIEELRSALDVAFGTTLEAIGSDHFALLSTRGGLSDLITLPLRISKLLGWAGLRVLLAQSTTDRAHAEALLSAVTSKVLEHYEGSIVSLSDGQAPYVLVYFLTAKDCAARENLEAIFGRLFSSYVACRGRVLAADANGEDAFLYVKGLQEDKLSGAEEYLEKPTTLSAVLLFSAAALSLQETVDPFLIELDHHSVNVFLPRDHRSFGDRVIEKGVNFTIAIGHNFWRCAEFVSILRTNVTPVIAADASARSPEIAVSSILASFLAPNRSYWALADFEGVSDALELKA